METPFYIRELLKKYVAGTCSRDEIDVLVDFFKNHDGDSNEILPDFQEIESFLSNYTLSDDAVDRIFHYAVNQKKTSKRKYLRKRYYLAAALIAILLSVGIFLTLQLNKPASGIFDPHSEHITLINEKGEVQIIDPEAVKIINTAAGTADQNKTTMVFSGSSDDTKLVYNTIRVPYGKTFRIVLSDGTAVDLNAGTSVTFPINFIESEPNRNVTMVGEAFFDVAKDVKHPFVVHTGEVDVNVVGTAFNVSNYPESRTSDIVLVRGAVTLTGNDDKQMSSFDPVMLSPGEKGTFHRVSRRVDKQPVLTDIYTAWIKGRLVFRNTPFENILKMIERRYNVEIINNNKELLKQEFNASFNEQTPEAILDYFRKNYGVSYKREKNKIIIN